MILISCQLISRDIFSAIVCVCVCVYQVLSRNVFKDYLNTNKNYYRTFRSCSNYKDYRVTSILPFNVAIYES